MKDESGGEAFMAFLELRLGTLGLGVADLPSAILASTIDRSLLRHSFSLNNRYRSLGGEPILTAWHYSSHALFLHELSRQCWQQGSKELAEKLYFLNVATTSCDLYYQVGLPLKTVADHPLGSVIGKADFGNEAALFFSQQCTIGNNKGVYPKVDGYLHMYSASTLLGNCQIKGMVVLASGARVVDAGLMQNELIVGVYPCIRRLPLSDKAAMQHRMVLHS
jgi:serine O-acetyltransferase